MNKTQLPKDFGLFHTFFVKDCIGSSEGIKMSYFPPKNGQNSTAPRFWTFPYFFPEDYIGTCEGVKMLYVPLKIGQNSTAPKFWTFLYFFCQSLYRE